MATVSPGRITEPSTTGTRSRSHCSAASTALAWIPAPSAASDARSTRSVFTGASRVAPSSTAFSMSSDVRFFRRGAK